MKYLFLLIIVILSNACSNERLRLLQEAEEIVPGNWEIVSVRLPKNGLGVTYQGHKFKADTILFNVGRIEIPDFSSDTLTDIGSNSEVSCTLTIDNENFPFGISSLFISGFSGDNIFAGWRFNGPDGSFPIITQAEQFVWSSRIFNNNYYIFLHDHDFIELGKANDSDGHVITLRRI